MNMPGAEGHGVYFFKTSCETGKKKERIQHLKIFVTNCE